MSPMMCAVIAVVPLLRAPSPSSLITVVLASMNARPYAVSNMQGREIKGEIS